MHWKDQALNDTQDKKAAQLWQQLEITATEWQRRLGTGSKVIPLYELRPFWTALVSVYRSTEHPLEKQAREFEISRLHAEVQLLKKSLAHAATLGAMHTHDAPNAREKKFS